MDIVLSICLQSDLPTGQSGKPGIPTQPAGPAPATSELSGSSKSHPVPSGVSLKPASSRQFGKRKEPDSMCMFRLNFMLIFFFGLFSTIYMLAILLKYYCVCVFEPRVGASGTFSA